MESKIESVGPYPPVVTRGCVGFLRLLLPASHNADFFWCVVANLLLPVFTPMVRGAAQLRFSRLSRGGEAGRLVVSF